MRDDVARNTESEAYATYDVHDYRQIPSSDVELGAQILHVDMEQVFKALTTIEDEFRQIQAIFRLVFNEDITLANLREDELIVTRGLASHIINVWSFSRRYDVDLSEYIFKLLGQLYSIVIPTRGRGMEAAKLAKTQLQFSEAKQQWLYPPEKEPSFLDKLLGRKKKG
jgi:hypothetical protein